MQKRQYNDFSSITDNLLEDEQNRIAFMNIALEDYQHDNNKEAFLLALRTVAKTKKGGIAEIARKSNLGEKSIYKTLSAKGNPKFETIKAISNSLGFELRFVPIDQNTNHV